MSEATKTGRRFLEGLAPREREVIELVGLFLTNGEIAARLGIGEHTACGYVRGLYLHASTALPIGREEIRSRIGLLGFLYFHGILECPCKARQRS
jgi:FixJ family two-component response regulator